MVEFLVGGSVLLLLVMGIMQLSLVWAGQSAVETAAHFAARKFAIHARADLRKARQAALAEATSLCLHRPGGKWGTAQLTSVDFTRQAREPPSLAARTGDSYRVSLTHWLELCVPWVNKILFAIAPAKKARIQERYFLLLQSSRWVTVE